MSFQDIVNYIEHHNKAHSRNGRGEFVDQTDHYVCDALNEITKFDARWLLNFLASGNDAAVCNMLRAYLSDTYGESAEEHAADIRASERREYDQARKDNEVLARAAS